VPKRLKHAREIESSISNDDITQKTLKSARQKWLSLEIADQTQLETGSGSVSDLRAGPLIQSKWSKSYISCSGSQVPLYNYYTPNHYVAGCVAIASAQIMRYLQYPVNGVGTASYNVKVDGTWQSRALMGGDGLGGAYTWLNMPYLPDCSTSEIQRQAIGRLMADCGTAVRMSYTEHLSTATLSAAKNAFLKIFDFNNAIYAHDLLMNDVITMLNSNLDAGLPVMLGVNGDASHAIIADGYGYIGSTMYHHLNMGWGGADDCWYNLPNVDSDRQFDVIDDCVYNIYISGRGEIISGRVTQSGAALNGVQVTAQAQGGSTYSVTTNEKGIYAIKGVPSNTVFTVSASKVGYSFNEFTVSTGSSAQRFSGNQWGIDFVNITLNSTLSVLNCYASTYPGVNKAITMEAWMNSSPLAPGEAEFVIESLPLHGKLFDPGGGEITGGSLPHTLVNHGCIVNYVPCEYYTGPDWFYFRASRAGISNLACAQIEVLVPSSEIIFETGFESNLPAGWTIVNGGSSNHTWTVNDGSKVTEYPFYRKFMLVDSLAAGSVSMDEQLVSEVFDFSNCRNIILGFTHELAGGMGIPNTGDVDLKVNGGPWVNVARFVDGPFNGPVMIDISTLAQNARYVQIRWHYYNANYAWYWCVDDVWIQAIDMPAPKKGDFDQNCCVEYGDLARLISHWLIEAQDPEWDMNCDISNPPDSKINFFDVAVFAKNWLVQ
jgi:hypothetical protein